ncbi:succinate dehydrogenase, hydrophobic membrane anchor protein [Novosphingobium arvoryzae]|uniref:Succinate dehydrogenase hydrophobic membrane anchor subunit n=1 Tax=Novosphingobium arvoryzae TaxID=1256514 RepID=A0A918RA84_9SPHN|nr:succinate dehydrogenase, hydrophobic membrane anchor protein [Novosphingobium arvoryzae]GGZ91731.1 succinate dehydrogenase, hydrophobic membrane anchor protein [Novosphingobium arvoryzae]
MGNGTSIGRVRGLGSAHSGAHHWLVQRFSAIGNLVLGLWLIISLITLPDYDFKTVREWISGGIPATAMALLVVSAFWHARLGIQVLIEDYVYEHANKFACMALLNLSVFAGAAFGLFSIVRLALGAA